MSQSTLPNDLPGGPPLRSAAASRLAAALRPGLRWLDALDRILRGDATRPQALKKQAIQIPVAGLSLLILLLALSYGFCMGMFPGCREDDPSYKLWLSCTLKIPALFFLTLCVTFPSLYVVNALVGSRLRLGALLQLLVAALAVNLAVLASAGPIVAFFSFSTANSPFMVLLNVLVFGVSGVLGMKFLLQTLHRLSTIPQTPPRDWDRPAVATGDAVAAADPAAGIAAAPAGDAPTAAVPPAELLAVREDEPSALDVLEGHVLGRHVKTVFCCWTVIFGVVGSQMAWVLRPYFGSPGDQFVWFAPRSSNFFEGVSHALQKLLW